MDFLQFTFQSPWHFFGMIWLIAVMAWGFAFVVSAARGRK